MDIPYKMIKKATFEVNKAELIDQPHAARLQYNLLCMDPIIKAYVEFAKAKITVIYNPEGASNSKPKISLDGLISFLKSKGINVSKASIKDESYDYEKEFYEYAFNAPEIREITPYTYTLEQWKKLKSKWIAKQKEIEKSKIEKFRNYQKGYASQHKELND
ncbi:MAG: hypothetical protein QXD11_00645 [Candidatus Micrarchaeaceae archaeon]